VTTPSFVGDWLVSEYLYTPAGEFAGIIRQRRQLQPQGDVIRVVQICESMIVADDISNDAKKVVDVMNKRVGEFVFDLKLVGKARHYLGDDVIGGGFSWRDGVLTAIRLVDSFRLQLHIVLDAAEPEATGHWREVLYRQRRSRHDRWVGSARRGRLSRIQGWRNR